MANIALIETTPSSTDFHRWFDFEFDRYALSTAKKKKIHTSVYTKAQRTYKKRLSQAIEAQRSKSPGAIFEND